MSEENCASCAFSRSDEFLSRYKRRLCVEQSPIRQWKFFVPDSNEKMYFNFPPVCDSEYCGRYEKAKVIPAISVTPSYDYMVPNDK